MRVTHDKQLDLFFQDRCDSFRPVIFIVLENKSLPRRHEDFMVPT